jgi:hypothetical protein
MFKGSLDIKVEHCINCSLQKIYDTKNISDTQRFTLEGKVLSSHHKIDITNYVENSQGNLSNGLFISYLHR